MNRKNSLLKLQIFLFFSEACPYTDKASEKKRNICNFNKCYVFLFIYI